MSDTFSTLRETAAKAIQDEADARIKICESMASYLGSAIELIFDQDNQGLGLDYAAWTNHRRTRGLVVKADPVDGTLIAIDLSNGILITRGDGLRAILEKVLDHFVSKRL